MSDDPLADDADDTIGDHASDVADSLAEDEPRTESEDPLGDTETHWGDKGPDYDEMGAKLGTVRRKAAAGLSTALGRVARAIVTTLMWLGDALAKNALGFLYWFTRPIPVIGETFWQNFAERTLFLYHRRTGGDALGIEAVTQEQAELTPVKFKSAEQTDQDERAGWSAKNREKVWSPTTFGRSTMRLGKTPIIPLDNDSWQATSFAEARIAEAVDQGDTRPVYDVEAAELSATVDMGAGATGGAGQARADGGQVTSRTFDPRGSPIFSDMIIDVGGGEYDGQAISFWKAKELMSETTTTEEMERQEERGFLAGRSREDWQSWAMRIMLIAAAVALGGLIGPELINALLGDGGGGGGGAGGMIPFFLGV